MLTPKTRDFFLHLNHYLHFINEHKPQLIYFLFSQFTFFKEEHQLKCKKRTLGWERGPPKMAMTVFREGSANKLFRYPSIFVAAPLSFK
jgi:hypothetical protein